MLLQYIFERSRHTASLNTYLCAKIRKAGAQSSCGVVDLNSKELDYPTGPFSIGVGSVVVQEDKVLLVKITYGHKGWMLPGGYVRPGETIGEAVKREVLEETGLVVEPLELVSVRSRVREGRNDIYVTFMVKVVGGELRPDGKEIAETRYFTLAEMEKRTDVPKINPVIVSHILKAKPHFILSDFKSTPEDKYELWI